MFGLDPAELLTETNPLKVNVRVAAFLHICDRRAEANNRK